MTKKLILRIEIDGFNAEGLDEAAAEFADEFGTPDEARLDVALTDWGLFSTVGITIVKQADGAEDTSVFPYVGKIVGAEEGSES